MKGLILIINEKKERETIPYEYEKEEIKNLLKTYGVYETDSLRIKINHINPGLYIGSGKAQELSEIIKKNNYNLVVFNKNLTATQTRNLQEIWNTKVIDKTFLIIEIFKQRARTQEGKLQVELANLRYNLSRLKGSEYNLDQQHGMIGTRGGGERKIEYERRRIKERISKITKEIASIKKHREIQRAKRVQMPLPIVSIVGYTNAGKSTLLNTLSGKNDAYCDNLLFATLDPMARRVSLKGGFYAVFVDTVGFISGLPHLLVAAFSATLEEILYSDLIIHLHDITADIKRQNEVVKKTLKEIGAYDIPTINVFNKIDLVDDIEKYAKEYEALNPLFISALKKIGIENLLETINLKLSDKWKEYTLELPLSKSQIINKIESEFFIIARNYTQDKLRLTLRLTEENKNKLEKIIKNSFL